MAEVKAKVPYLPQTRKGLHDIMPDAPEITVPLLYEDPTQTLPTPPPPVCTGKDCDDNCSECNELEAWWTSQKETIDDLILRSNVHTCRKPVAGTDHSKPHRQGARMKPEMPTDVSDEELHDDGILGDDVVNPGEEGSTDSVILKNGFNGYVGTTNVDDYKYRPECCEEIGLYDYIQMYTKVKRTKKQLQEFLESVEQSESTTRDKSPGIPLELYDPADTECDPISIHAFQKDHPLWKTHYIKLDRSGEENELDGFEGELGEENEWGFPDDDEAAALVKGPNQIAKELKMMSAERVMRSSGWVAKLESRVPRLKKLVPDCNLRGSQWKTRIASARDDILAKKMKHAPTVRSSRKVADHYIGNDVVALDAYYFTKYFKALRVHGRTDIGDFPGNELGVGVGTWRLVAEDAKKSNNKRKASDVEEDAVPVKKPSCAYDSIFTVLLAVWKLDPAKWTHRFSQTSKSLDTLAAGFQRNLDRVGSLEQARDAVRRHFRSLDAVKFPAGHRFTSLNNVSDVLFADRCWGVRSEKCLNCNHTVTEGPGFRTMRYIVVDKSRSNNESLFSIADWANAHMTFETAKEAPPILVFALTSPEVIVNPKLRILVDGKGIDYVLCGVIYGGRKHFTSRIIKRNGDIWYNDGIETGRNSEFEGVLESEASQFLNHCVTEETTRGAAQAFYAGRCRCPADNSGRSGYGAGSVYPETVRSRLQVLRRLGGLLFASYIHVPKPTVWWESTQLVEGCVSHVRLESLPSKVRVSLKHNTPQLKSQRARAVAQKRGGESIDAISRGETSRLDLGRVTTYNQTSFERDARSSIVTGMKVPVVDRVLRLGDDREAILLLLKSCSEIQLVHVGVQSKFLFQVVSEYMDRSVNTGEVDLHGKTPTYHSIPRPTIEGLPEELQTNIAEHLDIRSLGFLAEALKLFDPECKRLVDLIICDAFRAVGLSWKSVQFLLSCTRGLITGDFLYYLLLCSGTHRFEATSSTMIIVVEMEEMVPLAAQFISASSEYTAESADACNDDPVIAMSTSAVQFKIIIRSSLCPQAWVMKQPYTNLFNWLSGPELFVGYHKLTFNRQAMAGSSASDDITVRWDEDRSVALVTYDSEPVALTCPSLARSSRDGDSLTFALLQRWASPVVENRVTVYWRLGSCKHFEGAARYLQVVDC
ncbi:hypothetical protein R3P38DRAFT_2810498 [Favolaschia claudopus]|uniref:Uncharacterized protein n=1 Tax=Favolaschia claudopus TaxID=2862362 RepID=A0AAV9ZAT0_9AGAR